MNTMKERFDELLTHYKRSKEGENTAVNKLRKEPNSVLEREIKSFIQSEIDLAVAKREEEIVEGIDKLYQDEHPVDCIDGVTPVETYGYEETHNSALKQVKNLITKQQ